MAKVKRWLLALLVVALAASMCLPLAVADDPMEDNGLEIEYTPVDPEEGEEEPGEDGVEPIVPESNGEGLEGTGLTVDDGSGDDDVPANVDDAALDGPAPLEPTEQVYCPEGGLDEETAAEGFINRAMYEQPTRGRVMLRASFAYTSGSYLTGADKRLYDALCPLIQEVAAGTRSDTRFKISVKDIYDDVSYTASDLGVSSLYYNGEPSAAAVNAFWDRITPDIGNVMRALMADYPYEMFWFDKTTGIRWSYAAYEVVGDRIRLLNYDTATVTFKFAVCAAYSVEQKTGTYTTDAQRFASVKLAAQNAQAIVADASTRQDDYAKLDFYRQTICDLVTYNSAATASGVNYGDPWQLVYVFDNNTETNVVCEGYSKAFQYLCDMTNFDEDKLYAISVTGNLYNENGGGGRHMWNLVHMGGENYLVDLTNCDGTTVGAPDLLFMKGYSYAEFGDSGTTYYFQVQKPGGTLRTMRYLFSEGTINLHQDQTLAISDNPISPGEQQTSGNVGDLRWSLSATGLLYIRGSGPIPDFDDNIRAPWAGADLKRVTLSNGVTRIGARAFRGCPNLTQVTIPPSVESIDETALDDNAFMRDGCKGLIIQTCLSQAVVQFCRNRPLVHSVRHGATEILRGKAATCTEPGLTQGYKCSVCGYVVLEQEIIDAKGHQPVAVAAVPATCTKPGSNAGTKCKTCGVVLSGCETVAAKGHERIAVAAVPATCTKAGSTAGTKCKTCGAVLSGCQAVAAKGHARQTVKGRAATCTATGLTDGVKCSTCGTWLTPQQTIAAKGHTKQTVKGRAATCTATGLTDGVKCSVCGAWLTTQKTIAAKGHTKQTVKGKAATCTASGLTDGVKCSVCRAWLTQQKTIAAKGHTKQTVKGRAATYTASGLTDGVKCSTCGVWLTPQKTIAQLQYPTHVLGKKKNNGTITVNVGDKIRLVPKFATDAGASVTGYKSAKTKCVTVDGSGLFKAEAEGKSKITVTTNNKKVKATITVKVVDPYKVKGVSFAQGKSVTIKVGQKLKLGAVLNPTTGRTSLTWKTGKAAVATVDNDGWVLGVKKGKAKITVTTANKKKATITVYVVE